MKHKIIHRYVSTLMRTRSKPLQPARLQTGEDRLEVLRPLHMNSIAEMGVKESWSGQRAHPAVVLFYQVNLKFLGGILFDAENISNSLHLTGNIPLVHCMLPGDAGNYTQIPGGGVFTLELETWVMPIDGE